MSEHSEPDHGEQEQPRPLRDEEDARYLLHDRREIARVLQSLIERRALVSAYLAPRNRVFPTSLVAVSVQEETLSIDGSRDPAINALVQHCRHLTCVSMLDRIPIQFRLSGLSRFDADGLATFRTALPDRLLYLQRRDYHRCRVPVVEPLWCSVATAPAPGRPAPGPVQLGVFDISVGGMCLSLPTPCDSLGDGEIQGVLQLPDSEPIALRFVVRSRCFQPVTHHARELVRAGCQFTSLPRGAEAQLQRYIFRQDRQRKARERGEA
ncbi:MAG TPA: flagellar brake protein [Pseudoxanthomonas sp.]|nr:flagellar brake protein [Pseudoxanthomonas sp.]